MNLFRRENIPIAIMFGLAWCADKWPHWSSHISTAMAIYAAKLLVQKVRREKLTAATPLISPPISETERG